MEIFSKASQSIDSKQGLLHLQRKCLFGQIPYDAVQVDIETFKGVWIQETEIHGGEHSGIVGHGGVVGHELTVHLLDAKANPLELLDVSVGLGTTRGRTFVEEFADELTEVLGLARRPMTHGIRPRPASEETKKKRRKRRARFEAYRARKKREG